ncbi:MAG: DUF4097 family beta strand repeat-containing protein [Planctomycetota bacterium]|jgi:DUF4097 and DUF4098 domain-containing protein YvlB
MRSNRSITRVLVLVAAVLSVGGCIIHTDGWGPRAKAEKTVELEHPLEPGSTLAISTASGSIGITGQDVDHAHVVATIQARAATEEEARELADQVEIRFEQNGNKVAIKADRPRQRRRQSISISYQILAPRQTHIQCSSASGSVSMTDFHGDIDAHTASGSARAEHIRGSVRLGSSSGPTRCEDVAGGDVRLSTASGSVRLVDASEIGTCDLHAASGSVRARHVEADSIKMRSASGSVTLTGARARQMDLHSSSGSTRAEDIDCARLKAESVSGSVSVTFSPSTPGDVTAELRSGSGSVNVAVPPDFAGRVDLAVGSGSIHTDLPLTIKGTIGKKRVNGSIGEDAGRLTARTGSGSIRVR